MKKLTCLAPVLLACACAPIPGPEANRNEALSKAYASRSSEELWLVQSTTSDPLELFMAEAEIGARGEVTSGTNYIGSRTASSVGVLRYGRASTGETETGLDCSDFPSAAAAQRYFLAAGGPVIDPHNFDGDGDGFACEWGVSTKASRDSHRSRPKPPVNVSPVLAQEAPTRIAQADDVYFTAAGAELLNVLARQNNVREAKNVILFIGDGMSIPTITAARIREGQKAGRDGESNHLAFEDLLPHVALSKTYTNDSQVADSAPTATAMVAGVKANNGTIGVTSAVENDVCASQKGHEVTTIFELAEAAGYATGIVSTARITHSTPAATYAKTAQRDWENDSQLSDEAKAGGCKDIAAQLVDWPAGNGFEVILGGGRSNFMLADQPDPEGADKTGARTDGRDLVAEWQAKYSDAAYVWNEEGFADVDPAQTGHLMGLFERSHMQYEADRDTTSAGEPSLAEMTEKAIDVLARNDRGFVLMVEAGRIDHAHHAGNAYRALEDTIAVDAAVKSAFEKVDPEETLIIVTADHGHVFTMAGYPGRNNPILGLTGEKADDGKPYTTLGYMNGPGAVEGERPDLTNVDTQAPDFLQQALVPLEGNETHSGDDVAIYAQGPWAHLFDGVVEQNLIFHVMAHATRLPEKAALAGLSN